MIVVNTIVAYGISINVTTDTCGVCVWLHSVAKVKHKTLNIKSAIRISTVFVRNFCCSRSKQNQSWNRDIEETNQMMTGRNRIGIIRQMAANWWHQIICDVVECMTCRKKYIDTRESFANTGKTVAANVLMSWPQALRLSTCVVSVCMENRHCKYACTTMYVTSCWPWRRAEVTLSTWESPKKIVEAIYISHNGPEKPNLQLKLRPNIYERILLWTSSLIS